MLFSKHAIVERLDRNWYLVLIGWVALAIGLQCTVPRWKDVVLDGDLDFIPASLPSRVTQKLLDESFADGRGRSQISIIFARDDAKLTDDDKRVMYDVARHLTHESAIALYQRSQTSTPSLRHIAASVGKASKDDESELGLVKQKLDEALALDQIWFDLVTHQGTDQAAENPGGNVNHERLALAYWDRAEIYDRIDRSDLADRDREAAKAISGNGATPLGLDRRVSRWPDLLDVWTCDDPALGSKLIDREDHARMIVMQFESDFMSVRSVASVDRVRAVIDEAVKEKLGSRGEMPSGLKIGVSGSTVVGGDMLRAAADNLRQTEWITVISVLLILCFLYRSPILVAVPLLSIGLSLWIATSAIAMLANPTGDLSYLKPLKVFSTSRIFIVVLLFGIGTDFCMFFVARFRESLVHLIQQSTAHIRPTDRVQRRTIHRKCVWSSWIGVHEAILGSGVTTLVGLSMLYFSDFEKFRFTGVLIALSLVVTLVLCLTFTPCLLVLLGPWVTTEKQIARIQKTIRQQAELKKPLKESNRLWQWIADFVCYRSLTAFVLSVVLLGIPAVYSLTIRNNVSYDLVRELSDNAMSRQGIQLAAEHFNAFEVSPVTLLVTLPEPVPEKEMRDAIEGLKSLLYDKGAVSVRTVSDPLGEFPPGKRMGLLSADAWRRRALEHHPMVQSRFVASKQSVFHDRIARFDIIIAQDPFSLGAAKQLSSFESEVRSVCKDATSAWFGSTYSFGGATAGTVDLRTTTQADQSRIQMLVTVGILCTLIVILRQFWLSAYLVITVLFSYLSTLGCTYWFFAWLEGSSFVGLNWKVPLFLFVILVAVGQDYNVYLLTRVMEERRKLGNMAGLHRAMVQTGGIITSCGVIMAATFASMSLGSISRWLGHLGLPSWLGGNPEQLSLSGILELGFALSLGVLIDTMIVRSVLVPSALAIEARVRRMFA